MPTWIDEPDEWSEAYGTPDMVCDVCGEVRVCSYGVSPVDAEFRPDEEDRPRQWWCKPCYLAAGMDI